MARISGNGEGMICWRTASGALRSPPVCATLNVRSTRFFPTIDRTQRSIVVKRLAKPLRNARCTNTHTTHAGNAAQAEPPPAADGAEATDGGDAPEVAVAERLEPRSSPAQATADRVRGVQAALHRDLGDAGQVVEADHVAHREHLGMAGQREVGQRRDAPGPVDLRPARLGERARQR